MQIFNYNEIYEGDNGLILCYLIYYSQIVQYLAETKADQQQRVMVSSVHYREQYNYSTTDEGFSSP